MLFYLKAISGLNTVLYKSFKLPLISLDPRSQAFLSFFKVVLSDSSPGFLAVYQSFSLELATFSLTFSSVLVSDHYQKNVFVCNAN